MSGSVVGYTRLYCDQKCSVGSTVVGGISIVILVVGTYWYMIYHLSRWIRNFRSTFISVWRWCSNMYPARAGVKIGYHYQDLFAAFVHIHTSAA